MLFSSASRDSFRTTSSYSSRKAFRIIGLGPSPTLTLPLRWPPSARRGCLLPFLFSWLKVWVRWSGSVIGWTSCFTVLGCIACFLRYWLRIWVWAWVTPPAWPLFPRIFFQHCRRVLSSWWFCPRCPWKTWFLRDTTHSPSLVRLFRVPFLWECWLLSTTCRR